MIPNPWVILGVLLALAGFYGYGHHKGWVERDAEMQAEIAVKNEESRTKEQELAKQLNDQSSKLLEANNAISEKQSSLDRAIRAGRVRLPSTSCVQTNGNPTPASGNSSQAASESDTETLRLIAQIVADGDKAINQLNACIDAYQQVMEKANGSKR
jgi:CelD/BcsL family acetyltransferase involved in cellulose biosynthesis